MKSRGALWLALVTNGCGLLAPLSEVNQSLDGGALGIDAGVDSDVAGAGGSSGGETSEGGAGSDGASGTDAGGVGAAGGSSESESGSGGTSGSGGAAPAPGGAGAGGDSANACGEGDVAGRCVEVPEGWDGPVSVQRGSEDSLVTECPEPFSDLLLEVHHAEPSADPFACDSCSCASSDTGCELMLRTTSSCSPGVTPDPPTPLGPGQCFDFGGGASVNVLFDGVPEPTGAMCSGPAGGAITSRPLPSWDRSILGCAPSARDEASGECEGADVCVPDDNPFDSAICVFAAGELSCPSGFSDREVYYEEWTDSRSCQACGCSMIGDCRGPGVVIGYEDAACGTVSSSGEMWSECPDDTMPPMPPCTCLTLPLGPTFRAVRYEPTAECRATGGTPTGAVTPDASTAVTVCCQP